MEREEISVVAVFFFHNVKKAPEAAPPCDSAVLPDVRSRVADKRPPDIKNVQTHSVGKPSRPGTETIPPNAPCIAAATDLRRGPQTAPRPGPRQRLRSS